MFEKCTLDHEARMEVLQNKIREKMLSDSKWRQLQQDSNKSVSSLGSAHHLFDYLLTILQFYMYLRLFFVNMALVPLFA